MNGSPQKKRSFRPARLMIALAWLGPMTSKIGVPTGLLDYLGLFALLVLWLVLLTIVKRRRISMPLGSRTLIFLGYVFSRKTVSRVFEPAVQDMRQEAFEALLDNEGRLKLFFIQVRGYWALLSAVAHQLPFSAPLLKAVFKTGAQVVERSSSQDVSESTKETRTDHE